MRCKEKAHVERRIFTHQNRVEIFQRSGRAFFKLEMRRRARHSDCGKAPERSAAANKQIGQFHVTELMPAPLRFQHQHERGVLIDIDSIDGVHDDADSKPSHTESPSPGSSSENAGEYRVSACCGFACICPAGAPYAHSLITHVRATRSCQLRFSRLKNTHKNPTRKGANRTMTSQRTKARPNPMVVCPAPTTRK